jgi:hypothetical protein
MKEKREMRVVNQALLLLSPGLARILTTLFLTVTITLCGHLTRAQQPKVISPAIVDRYVTWFNAMDTEDVKNYIPNDRASGWLSQNIPLFECPDSILQQTYYYRWWTFRKHLRQTPDGFIFTEFITPVSHAGKHNAISCALGHHIYEGRWLHSQQYLDDYVSFWLYKDKLETKQKFHAFSSWVDDALYNRFLVHLDTTFLKQVLPALHADYALWEKERQLDNQMFWQHDVKDGMEESISGGRRVKNIRPTINSYMYGNALALSRMAALAGNDSLRQKYSVKATALKKLTQEKLWNDSAVFFEVVLENGKFSNAREAIGFVPWYFNLPDDKPRYAKAWHQLADTTGFNAPWGQTTAERRHPQFRTHGTGTCEWDGAVWPFATTQTMKALANLLTRYKAQDGMTHTIYFNELHKYARSHQKNSKPYLGEYHDEKNGYWLKGDHPRSSYYNHSGFCDLIISDLVGLKPRPDNILEVHPLIPTNQWNWFCLDNVLYHGHLITILWDKDGNHYNKGKGLTLYVNGKKIYNAKTLKPITVKLPN